MKTYKGIEFELMAIPAKNENDSAYWFVKCDHLNFQIGSYSVLETMTLFRKAIDEGLHDIREYLTDEQLTEMYENRLLETPLFEKQNYDYETFLLDALCDDLIKYDEYNDKYYKV